MNNEQKMVPREPTEAIRAAWQKARGRPVNWEPTRFDQAIYRAGLIAGMRRAAEELRTHNDYDIGAHSAWIDEAADKLEQEQP